MSMYVPTEIKIELHLVFLLCNFGIFLVVQMTIISEFWQCRVNLRCNAFYPLLKNGSKKAGPRKLDCRIKYLLQKQKYMYRETINHKRFFNLLIENFLKKLSNISNNIIWLKSVVN